MKNKIFNLCNIYTLVWLIYFFHMKQVNIPVVDAFSNVFLGFNMLVSLFYWYYANAKFEMPIFLKATNILLIAFIVYGLISVISGEAIYLGSAMDQRMKNGSYMIGPMRSFLPLYAYFVWSKQGYVTEKSMKVWFFIFFAHALYAFFNQEWADSIEIGEFVNNNAYLFTTLLPFIFLFKKNRTFSLVALVILLYFVLMGLKRGAILTAAIFAVFFVWRSLRNSSSSWQKMIIVVAMLIAVGVGGRFVVNFYSESTRFQQKVLATQEGSTSGRDVLAQGIWRNFSQESNLGQVLFGHGADGTLRIGNNYAHNDWLEMLCDMGIIGILLYLAFWVAFIYSWRKASSDRLISDILLGCIVLLLPRTAFSMFYSNMEIYLGMLIGYCMTRVAAESKKRVPVSMQQYLPKLPINQ